MRGKSVDIWQRSYERCTPSTWLKWVTSGLIVVTGAHAPAARSQSVVTVDPSTQQWLRQQERERSLRDREEAAPAVRLERPPAGTPERLPAGESPCFVIRRIVLDGADAAHFRWALKAAGGHDDPALGRCLGTQGVNVVMKRVQNAILARGYVTTRVLAKPQDLRSGVLTLTVVPGRIHAVRFAPGVDARALSWRDALPARPGDRLNLRDIEQGLENLKRVPSAEADIQIAPTEGEAQAGQSDLVIAWKQTSHLRLALSLDDSGSGQTGKIQGTATLSLDNLLTWNDLFYVNLGRDVFNGSRQDKGTRNDTLHYDIPYGYWALGATVTRYTYRQTVAGYAQNYAYSGASHNAEIRLSRLLYRNATRTLGAYASAWERDSNNYIDDTEVLVQRRRQGGWEAGFTYRQFIGAAVLDAHATYRRGTGAFHALPAPEEAFGEGSSHTQLVAADATLAVPFQLGRQHLRYVGGWRAQWSPSPLVPQDRFAIGGRYTVRGFDGELSLIGDRGWLVRNDVGLSVGGGQEVYLGADVGHVGGASTRWELGRTLAGAVLGLRGGWRGITWDLFVGAPLYKPRGFQSTSPATGFMVSWTY